MIMNGRPSCTLEIMVISGENLCVGRNPLRENAYVVVRAESLKCCTTRMAKAQGEGDSSSNFLSWNDKFLLDIPTHARSITFEVKCRTSNNVVKSVGVARIAISDFFGGKVVSESSMQMLSYRLRDSDGRRNGVIHFSVRAKPSEDQDSLCSGSAKQMPPSFSGFEGEVMGFQVSNGVVVGIPVSWSYPRNI